jgi:3',5'-cyclic AMP phosphodiesterase CpdA
LIKNQTVAVSPPVQAVVQLGDLVEGVSGTPLLARQMDRGAVDLLYSVNLQVPWILAKGNHDVSNSPGQPEGWQEVIRPFIEGQVQKKIGNGMYTYKISDQVEFFVLDQFISIDQNLPESEMVAFLETEFAKSTATYKFVLTHQPVIPVTERCWHLLSGIRRPVQDSTLRIRFLNLLGKNKAVVLCAHLHQYSVLSRQTPSGPIVQIMVNSVNRDFDSPLPNKTESEYKGGEWVSSHPEWQPFNRELRFRILEEERKQVKSFYKADLPGYCVLTIYPNEQKVMMDYFNGFSVKPFQSINITDLQQ